MKRITVMLIIILWCATGFSFAEWWKDLESGSRGPESAVEQSIQQERAKLDEKTLKDAAVPKEDITTSSTTSTATQEDNAATSTASESSSSASSAAEPSAGGTESLPVASVAEADPPDANPIVGGAPPAIDPEPEPAQPKGGREANPE